MSTNWPLFKSVVILNMPAHLSPFKIQGKTALFLQTFYKFIINQPCFLIKNVAIIFIMKNVSLYLIVDLVFKFILLFLFNLIWCTYFISNTPLALSLSVVLAILTIFIIYKINGKKEIKKLALLNEEQKIENIKNTFLFMTNQEITVFFYKLALSRHGCTKYENYIQITTPQNPIILYPHFKCATTSQDDILQIYKMFKNKPLKRLIILTNQLEPNAQAITQNFKFETLVLNHKETYYSLLKPYEFYPEIQIKHKPKTKNTFRQILSVSLNKKKTKGYFLSALFLLFSSLFTRYKIYYLIFSSILIVLALISRFNPSFNKIEKAKIFD